MIIKQPPELQGSRIAFCAIRHPRRMIRLLHDRRPCPKRFPLLHKALRTHLPTISTERSAHVEIIKIGCLSCASLTAPYPLVSPVSRAYGSAAVTR